jgi:ABC-type nickel/cobalt efflux system permease component RcnA
MDGTGILITNVVSVIVVFGFGGWGIYRGLTTKMDKDRESVEKKLDDTNKELGNIKNNVGNIETYVGDFNKLCEAHRHDFERRVGRLENGANSKARRKA